MPTGQTDYQLKGNSDGLTSAVGKAERSIKDLDKSQLKAGKSAKDLGDKSTGIDKLKKSFSGLGAVVGALGIGAAFTKMIQATSAQDAAMAQLNATLRSTEGAAGKTAAELTATAGSLQRITSFGDEAIIGMQSLLLTFKEIKGDNFDRTTTAVLDMATAMGTDLKSASIQVGKALNDPVAGLSALSRSGIQFTEDQKDLIGALVETGNQAEAQALILGELESQFGGSAKAARETLGGALSGLSNAWGDLFEAETEASGSMVSGINDIEKAISSPGFKSGIALLISSLGKVFEWMTKIGGVATGLGEKIASGIDYARERWGLFSDGLDEAGEALTATIPVVDLLSEVTVTATRSNVDLTSSTNDVSSAALREASAIVQAQAAAKEHAEDLKKLNTIKVQSKKITVDLGDAEKKAAKAQSERVAQISAARDSLSNIFAELATDGKSAYDTLTEGFTAMLKKMVADAAANKILLSIGTLVGGAGFAGSAQGQALGGAGGAAGVLGSLTGGGGSGLLGGLSSIGGLLSGGVAGLGTNIATGLSSIGLGNTVVGLQNAGAFFAPGASGVTQVAAGAGLSLGAGLLGGYAGGKVFGETTGIGSTLGGLAGTVLGGPLGAGIGSFLGTGAEKVLGGVFGFGQNNGNNQGFTSFNLANGLLDSQGVGKTFEQENVDSSRALAEQLKAVADAIGGSAFSGKFEVGNNSGIQYFGTSGTRNFGKDFDAALRFGLEETLKAADQVDERLRDIILGFQGLDSELGVFTGSILAITNSSGINTVTQAIEQFNAKSLTMAQSATVQNGILDILIDGYDGSAQSAQVLATALQKNKEDAYQFALAIQSIGKQINDIAGDQAQYFRDALLTEEQLQQRRISERDELRASLETLVDPEKIAETSGRILELNRSIFDKLSEDQKAAQAESFASLAESTGQIANEILQTTLTDLQATQEDINQRVAALLDDAATRQQQAAEIQFSAANIFSNASQLIASTIEQIQEVAT